MLIRVLLVALLSFTSSAWADKDNSFCRGFIIKALDEYSIEGPERIDFWLGWGATVERTGSEGKLNASEYQAGRDHFDSRFSSGGTSTVLDVRDDDCDMGRNDGWFW